MKIAFLVTAFPKFSETFILNQITGLIDRGHDVDIYSMGGGDGETVHPNVERYRLLERTRYSNRSSHSRLPRSIETFGIVFRGNGWLRPTIWLAFMNLLKSQKKAGALGVSRLTLLRTAIPLITNGPYDIIHCQFGTLGPLAVLLKHAGVIEGKLVTSFRGYDATKSLQDRPKLYEQLFREGDLFLPVSRALRQRLIDVGCAEAKIRVLHSGIDCARFPYSERQFTDGEPLNVLTIARLVEKKGLAYAIRAVARLIASGRRIRYTVVGDGVLRRKLEYLIEDLGVRSEVQILGWRNHDEVVALFQQAHVLLAPSITGEDGDQEGIPNAVKEAMASGLPVLSTFHGGIPELVEDGVSGFLVPERDVDTLADRLAYLNDHPEKWPEMGRAGRARVESDFDIHRLNDRLLTLYAG